MFRPIMENQTDLPFEDFHQIDVKASLSKKQDLMGAALDDNDNLTFSLNDTSYDHKTYIHRGGIYVFRIANNTHRPAKVETDFKVSIQKNHPSCLVIIDNRKDRQIIAIEHNSAFGKTPPLDLILQTTLRQALRNHRLTLDVTPKYHTSEFWQVVDTSMQMKGVEFVQFPFPYPNLPKLTQMMGDLMRDVAVKTNSEPTLRLIGQNKESVHLDPSDQMILDAIKACAASGRPILIKPKGHQVRKIGMKSPVYEDIADAALSELNTPQLFDTKYDIILEFLNNIKLVYE